MSRNGGDEEVIPRQPSSGGTRTGPDPLLVVCRCFSFVTALAAILCIAVNVLSAIRSFKNGYDVISLFLDSVFIYICIGSIYMY